MKKTLYNLWILIGSILSVPFLLLFIVCWAVISIFVYPYFDIDFERDWWKVTEKCAKIIDKWADFVWQNEY